MNLRIFAALSVLSLAPLLLSGCPSAPVVEEPQRDLTTAPRRAIEGTQLVFVAQGEDRFSERAKFLAENAAYEDIANECSLIPNGAKLEGTQEKPETTESRLFFARAVVDLQACEEAKKASTPEQVRQLADASLTDQMKRYQDIVGEANDPAPVVQAALLRKSIRNEADLMQLRQQIVYQKQKLITDLNAKPSDHLAPMMAVVSGFEKANAKLSGSKISWSYVQHRALQPVAEPVLSESTRGKSKNSKGRPALPPKRFPKSPKN